MARRGHNEGTIVRRADGRWVAAATMGDGKRKWLYGRTRAEVAGKLTATLKTRQDGLPVVSEKQTVAQYLEAWLRIVRPSLRQSAYASYDLNVRRALPHLGSRRLARLTSADLQGLYSALLERGMKGRPLSKRSVEQCHTVLHTALKQAVGWGLLARNPAEFVAVPRPERQEMRTLSQEQVEALVERTTEHRLHALWVLLPTTGLRLGEALGLKWGDLDFGAGTLQVRRALQHKRGTHELILVEPKSKQSRRTVELVEHTAAILSAHRRRQAAELQVAGADWDDRGLVFTTPTGEPLHPRNVGDTFRRLLPRIGLPRVRLHDLRHTAATLLLSWGQHPKVVQEMLGHSTIAITLDLYSHVVPGMHREAARQFGRLFRSESRPAGV
jgi:integrase